MNGWKDFGQQMRGALWLVIYLPGVAVLSYIGSDQFGGIGWLPFGWDLLIVAVFGASFFFWGLKSGWKTIHLEASEQTLH
jgi:hypothetical protein